MYKSYNNKKLGINNNGLNKYSLFSFKKNINNIKKNEIEEKPKKPINFYQKN